MLPTASQLTNGERLRIARRRRNLTQAQFARRFRVQLGAYKRIEADIARGIRAPAIKRVLPFEACRVLRVRKGLTLGELAPRIGVSKWWLCLMERGAAPATTLLEFWTRR